MQIAFGAIIILLNVPTVVYSQKVDTVRQFERSIYLEAGTVATPGSDKDALGNFILGLGYQQEIASGSIGNNVISLLLGGGLGISYYLDLQGGMQLTLPPGLYFYLGAQYMMYYELGSSRGYTYDVWANQKIPPDRIINQLLPNFGIGWDAEKFKIECMTSTFYPQYRTIRYYFVFRAYLKI